MTPSDEKMPNPKELEKEISEFLAKRFGNSVKVASPVIMAREPAVEPPEPPRRETFGGLNFDLLPEELSAYLGQYIIKQDDAKSILATKICTHFNRIRRRTESAEPEYDIVGRIKNNILMIGPTGVGKTYMIKLIANKIGVPFVKGDATKFSETGYVGGDVEDLVRDLVREADGDIDLAQYGIIYIDEVDKIAGSRNIIGADVSRTGVQRALLKPMEETEVDLKVPHDPISMIQEIERFRKTGKREERSVNTRNILFIMSGAFNGLAEIVRKRTAARGIGFGANVERDPDAYDILKKVKSEDLTEFGFESEFVGRLPVLAVFERLSEQDLYAILKNPNNPVILGKKLDFAAYGIDAKFDAGVFETLAAEAYSENTGARGLVSAVERALLPFEEKLPSLKADFFPATPEVLADSARFFEEIRTEEGRARHFREFERLREEEKTDIRSYVSENRKHLSEKHKLTLTASRTDLIAEYYARNTLDVDKAADRIKSLHDEVKKIELSFYKNHDINIVLEEDAIDHIIRRIILHHMDLSTFYARLSADLEHGLKLIREKSGRNRFFITTQALQDPNTFLSNLIKGELKGGELQGGPTESKG